MTYITQRDRAVGFIKQSIIPLILTKVDMDYNKLLGLLLTEKGISNKLATECLNGFISQGIIKIENNILTIPDAEVEDWIKKIRQEEQELKKELEVLK